MTTQEKIASLQEFIADAKEAYKDNPGVFRDYWQALKDAQVQLMRLRLNNNKP